MRAALRLALLAACLAAPALPQCAMCREAAASQREEAVAALNKAIIVLGLPPFAIAVSLGWFAWKRREG